MEKIMYPSKNIWITQIYGVGTYSHTFNKALDDQGKNNTTIDNFYAPFTGKVVRKYQSDNEVWFQSINKVVFADGTVDYATILMGHDNNISDLKIGQIIKQGVAFYQEGKKGKVTGNHVHFEIQAGLTKTWVKAKDGSWNLPKGKNPEDCYFIDDSYNVIKTLGLKFKKATDTIFEPSYVIYKVKSGDYLSKIAKAYKTTWQKIYSDNKADIDRRAIKAGKKKDYFNYLEIGQELKIYK